jgi:hypothetical protein
MRALFTGETHSGQDRLGEGEVAPRKSPAREPVEKEKSKEKSTSKMRRTENEEDKDKSPESEW